MCNGPVVIYNWEGNGMVLVGWIPRGTPQWTVGIALYDSGYTTTPRRASNHRLVPLANAIMTSHPVRTSSTRSQVKTLVSVHGNDSCPPRARRTGRE